MQGSGGENWRAAETEKGSGMGMAGQTGCHGDRHGENEERAGAEFIENNVFSFSSAAEVRLSQDVPII